jgi:hypothetical protein
MGQMRFIIPRPDRLVAGAEEQAYLAGGEGIPWECHTTLTEGALVIERDTRESGYLYFPWVVAGRGLVQLSSGSLMERLKAYNLPVELARGTLNRLRNQAWMWQMAGMVIPQAFNDIMLSATSAFSLAATRQDEWAECHEHCDEAIRLGLEAGDLLTAEYAQQVLALRRNQQAPLGTLLGARLEKPLEGDAVTTFLSACNMALVGLHWPDLEPQQGTYRWDATDQLVQWCQSQRVRLCLGPLLQMDKHSLPDWLFLDDDYEEVQMSILSYVEAIAQRYRGKVQLWHVAARMNQEGALEYSEEQRLRLVVEAVDRLRSVDSRTPMVVSFDQPWGEAIARKDQELTPLHFADTLVRGELGLAGVGMEINYGYWPGGTLPRDPLEVSRQIDRWSQLGVPLMVFLSVPSTSVADPIARHPAKPLAHLRAGGPNPAWQRSIAQWLLPLLVAKQSVQALVWDAWQDNAPHELPASGLYDIAGKPKPALQTLIQVKRDWLS